MTLIWFVVWLVFNLVVDTESLTVDPVNGWAGLLLRAIALDPVNIWTASLILAIALDLARQHAPELGKTSGGD